MNIINQQLWIDHEGGYCDESTCPYCNIQEELNEEYNFRDKRNSKVAKVGRSEKSIRRI